jgi:small subunit ribosomal protein S20
MACPHHNISARIKPMPNLASTKKRLRQSLKRTERNKSIRTKMKTALKKALADPNPNNVKMAIKAVDKAAKRHVIHANKAARLKAKVMRQVST